MLQKLTLPALLTMIGLIGIVWSGITLLLPCPVDQFGCNPDSRIWVLGVLIGSAVLALPRLYQAGKFALQFREYWNEGAARDAEERRQTKNALRADLDRLVNLMGIAKEQLAEPELDAGVDSTVSEHEAVFSDIMRRNTLKFAVSARAEPARIVAWLMINQIKEQPIDFFNHGDDAPFVGGLRANGEQSIMRLIGDAKSVTLMDSALEDQIGGLVAAPDMVEIIQARGLPVWGPLLGR